jgi:phage gp46-like protein
VPGDRLGSRLWLLRRRRLDADTLRDAEYYIREALQWMLDDGAVTRLDVQLAVAARDALRCRLVLHMGARVLELTLDNLWQVIHAV